MAAWPTILSRSCKAILRLRKSEVAMVVSCSGHYLSLCGWHRCVCVSSQIRWAGRHLSITSTSPRGWLSLRFLRLRLSTSASASAELQGTFSLVFNLLAACTDAEAYSEKARQKFVFLVWYYKCSFCVLQKDSYKDQQVPIVQMLAEVVLELCGFLFLTSKSSSMWRYWLVCLLACLFAFSAEIKAREGLTHCKLLLCLSCPQPHVLHHKTKGLSHTGVVFD